MQIVFAGATDRFEREQQGRAWMAWHVAALPRVKKFPTLESLISGKRKAKRQTVSEMEAIFKAWASRG
jgi:hypothetical protein